MSPRGTRPSPYTVLHVAIAVVGVAVAFATGRYALVLGLTVAAGLLSHLSGVAHIHRRDASRRREAETRYRKLVEQLPLITYVDSPYSGDESVDFVSPQIETLLGYTQAEWHSRPDFFVEQLHPDDRERVRTLQAAARETGEALDIEYRLRARDGSYVWLWDSYTVVRDASGAPWYSQGFALDITARKHAEDDREELLTQAQLQNERLLELDRVKDEFIALVSRVRERLLALAGGAPEYEAVLLQGSGTYAVEAMIGTFVPAGSRLLVVDNGAYGARMGEIAGALRIDARVLSVSPCAPVDPAAVAQALADDRQITHVAAVHCETTTGVLNPIGRIGEIAHAAGRAMLADAMSAFGAVSIDVVRDHLDAVEGKDAHDHGHPQAAQSLGQKAARQSGEIVEAHRRQAEPENTGCPEDDEQHDGRHLDEGQPIFRPAEIADRSGIHKNHDGGKAQRP